MSATARTEVPGPLDDLRARLERTRARLQGGRYLRSARTALWCAAAAAVVASGARTVTTVTSPSPSPVPAGTPLVAALVVLVAALAVGLTRVRRTRPSLLDLARRAEEREGLDERLSTALEWAEGGAGGGRGSVVGEALLSQAAASAARVDPRRLVERRRAREAGSLALPLALALLALALPSSLVARAPAPSTSAAAPEPAAAARARDEATTDLRRSAELVARRAEERGDAYLQALARDLSALEERVAAAATTPGEAAAELDRLLEDLADAYGLERTSSLAPAASSGEPAPRGAASPPDAARPADGGLAPGGPEAAEAGAAEPPTGSSTTAPEAFAELLEQLDDRARTAAGAPPPAPRDPGAPSPLEGVSRADITGYIFEEDVEQYERQRRFQERLPPQAGASIGAARQSSRGDSRRAGEGSQELAGDEPAAGPEAALPGAELPLPDAARASGRRITLQLPPETRRSDVDAAPPGGEGWRRGEEAPAERHVVGLRELEAVSRYFVSDEAPPDGAGPP